MNYDRSGSEDLQKRLTHKNDDLSYRDEDHLLSCFFFNAQKTRGKKIPSPSNLRVNPKTLAKFFLGH